MTQFVPAASYAGYLFDVLRTLLALAGVCLLAYVVLRMLSRHGFGLPVRERPVALRVVGRVALDSVSSLQVVRIGSRCFLIGVGRGAAPRLISELDLADLAAVEDAFAPGQGQGAETRKGEAARTGSDGVSSG